MIAENHKKAEELKSDKGFVFEVCVSFFFFLVLSLSIFFSKYQILLDSNGKRKGI